MHRGAGQRSRDKGALGRPDLGNAGDVEKLLPARLFELAPESVGVPQQRDIGRMLEIAEPNDARQPMGGAAVVPGLMTLEAQHALASARQVRKRRASHRAQAAHGDIEMAHAAVPVPVYSFMRAHTL